MNGAGGGELVGEDNGGKGDEESVGMECVGWGFCLKCFLILHY